MAHRKTKRPHSLLRGYALFLNGSSQLEMLKTGIKMDEIVKIQSFHDSISQNIHYITIAYQNNIDLKLAKRLLNLYEAHIRGEPLSYFPQRSQLTYAFRLLLNGLSDDEMLAEGLTASEIESAKRFLEIAPDADKMLLHTLGQKFGVSRDTAARLLRIYRDKQAAMKTIEEMQENIGMPITA